MQCALCYRNAHMNIISKLGDTVDVRLSKLTVTKHKIIKKKKGMNIVKHLNYKTTSLLDLKLVMRQLSLCKCFTKQTISFLNYMFLL